MTQLMVAQNTLAEEEAGRAALADSAAELTAAAAEQQARAAGLEVEVAQLKDRLSEVRRLSKRRACLPVAGHHDVHVAIGT